MPWTCKSCKANVPDSSPNCPGCSSAKSVWSLQPDKTRNFVISRAKFELLRGEETEPTGSDSRPYDPYALVKPDVARVLSKQAALALFGAAQQPASYDILVVRLFPKDDMGDVKLGVDFAVGDLLEQRFPVPESPFVDVPFVFVAGPETMPEDFGFAGLNVVDLTEDTERGFAPDLEFTALNRPTVELPTEATEPSTQAILRVETTATRCFNDSGLCMPLEGRPHPLAALICAAKFLAQNPQHVLHLVGHASQVGGDGHNQALSEARSAGLLQLIRADREGWIQTATNFGSLRDVKAYLDYLTRERGWTCDPGPITLDVDDAAKRGVEAFQAEYNQRHGASILEDGVCGVLTLGAVFDVLSLELDRWLEKHGLQREHLRLGEPPALGAGEAFTTSPQLPPSDGEDDRRFVDLLLVGPEAGLSAVTPEALYGSSLEISTLPIADEPDAWESTEVRVLFPNPDPDEADCFHLVSHDGSYDQVGHCEGAARVNGTLEIVFTKVDWSKTYRLVRIHGPSEKTTVYSSLRFHTDAGRWDPEHIQREPSAPAAGDGGAA